MTNTKSFEEPCEGKLSSTVLQPRRRRESPSLGSALQMQQEQQREKGMADVRRDITSQFQALAKDLENQIQIQLWEFEKQVYGEIEKQIAAARHQQEEAIADSNQWVRQLTEIRKDFEAIICYVTQATEAMVA